MLSAGSKLLEHQVSARFDMPDSSKHDQGYAVNDIDTMCTVSAVGAADQPGRNLFAGKTPEEIRKTFNIVVGVS